MCWKFAPHGGAPCVCACEDGQRDRVGRRTGSRARAAVFLNGSQWATTCIRCLSYLQVLNPEWKGKRTGKVWRASDIWSLGVVLFLMLTGEVPFNAIEQKVLFARITRGEYKFPPRSPSEPALSDAARDLVSQMLTVDPAKRISAYDALHHPFITGAAPLSDAPLPARIVDGFKNFRVQYKLQLAVGRALRMDLTDQDRKELQALFQRFDKDRNGKLGPDEVDFRAV